MNTKENDQQFITPTYARFNAVLTAGHGCIVSEENGKKYIDMTAGIGVNSLGHAHPEWVEAVCKQASTLAHASNLYYTQPDVQVAKTLCEKTGFKNMFFSNSGAEANEGAIKVARKYSFDKYGTDRHEIITLYNSFHGRTITTLSATGQDHFHQYFDPFTPGFVYVNANDNDDLRSKISDKTCAIMIEMIQGEGGVLPLQQAFVNEIASICKERDILCIVDEVQTGIGRCSSLFAYEQFHITPDIVTVAKGLGNGLPIGGVLLNKKVANTLSFGDHGTTFGGNPVACAGANVVLSYMNDDFFQEIKEKGEYIRTRLLAMKHITQVNGMGLMLGAVVEGINVNDIVKTCLAKGLLLLTAKDRLRFLPPLIIHKDELEDAMNILEEILTNWEVK